MARAWGHEIRNYKLFRNQQFEHRTEEILQAVDENTRLVFVNSPHNPTGAVVNRAELDKLASTLA